MMKNRGVMELVEFIVKKANDWTAALETAVKRDPFETKKTLLRLKGEGEKNPLINEYILKCDQDIIRRMNEIKGIQGQEGNWDCDEYMRGMFNGMEILMATYENRDPNFKEPKAYEDIRKDG